MMLDNDDFTVRAALRELREADRIGAPEFDTLLARPARVPWPVGRLAIAAGVLVATALGIAGIARRTARFTVPREVVALSTWQPMTHVLLDTPAPAFLTRTRAIDSTMRASWLPLPTSR